MTRRDPSQITPTNAASAPRGAAAIPSNIDHLSAQAELDALLFPHYLLGRQLALEETVRELVLALPPSKRAAIAQNLSIGSSLAMERVQDGIEDPKELASTAGYIATLLQQGF